jgi:hypothetical protein
MYPVGDGGQSGIKKGGDFPALILRLVFSVIYEKNFPLRSRPIAPSTVVDVPAGSDTKLNPVCPARGFTAHSSVALVCMNSPTKWFVASRTWASGFVACQRVSNETVTGTVGIGGLTAPIELAKSWKSVMSRLVMWKRAVPSPRCISTALLGTGIVQNTPFGMIPGSLSWT